MTCHWCGDRHGADQLCQRAERGMTRRSFCFLFGAGIAGALLLAKKAPKYLLTGITPMGETLPRYVRAGVDLAQSGDITAINLYTSDGGGKWIHYKTFPASVRVLSLP